MEAKPVLIFVIKLVPEIGWWSFLWSKIIWLFLPRGTTELVLREETSWKELTPPFCGVRGRGGGPKLQPPSYCFLSFGSRERSTFKKGSQPPSTYMLLTFLAVLHSAQLLQWSFMKCPQWTRPWDSHGKWSQWLYSVE